MGVGRLERNPYDASASDVVRHAVLRYVRHEDRTGLGLEFVPRPGEECAGLLVSHTYGEVVARLTREMLADWLRGDSRSRFEDAFARWLRQAIEDYTTPLLVMRRAQVGG